MERCSGKARLTEHDHATAFCRLGDALSGALSMAKPNTLSLQRFRKTPVSRKIKQDAGLEGLTQKKGMVNVGNGG